MATANITVPTGEGANIFAYLATIILEKHGKDIGDAAINKNFALAYLNSKGKVMEVGGLDFAEPVLIEESGNFAFQNKYSTITANQQAPLREFKFDPVVLSGAVVVNKIHELMNKGPAQIKRHLTVLMQQAETTVQNKLNTSFWASSPTANIEPESIRTIVADSPTSGTLGGITRSGNTWAQNKVSATTISSVGSAAGVASLHTFRIKLGGSAKVKPDFALTTATIFGLLMGYMDNNRRLRSDEQMTKLGLENFYFGTALLGYDGDGGTGECPANHFYYLNSDHLFYKILEGANMTFEPMSYKDNSLNMTSVFYHSCNLTTNLPSSMGVLTAITG